jgi:hypothetical protein
MDTLSPFKDESGAGAEPPCFDELPFEDLLQSVLRGAVWEEQLLAGAPGAAGAAAGATQAASGAETHQAVSRSGGLRCLDATHAPGCELCLPPPVVGEEGAGLRRVRPALGTPAPPAEGAGAPAQVRTPAHRAVACPRAPSQRCTSWPATWA